jgi:hypothetical protein
MLKGHIKIKSRAFTERAVRRCGFNLSHCSWLGKASLHEVHTRRSLQTKFACVRLRSDAVERQARTCYDTEPNRARRGNVNSGEMVEVKPTTAILL